CRSVRSSGGRGSASAWEPTAPGAAGWPAIRVCRASASAGDSIELKGFANQMGDTLLKKVWDLHTVRQLPTGQTQLFIGLHLVHEVTSPQAFDTLRANGWKVP